MNFTKSCRPFGRMHTLVARTRPDLQRRHSVTISLHIYHLDLAHGHNSTNLKHWLSHKEQVPRL